MKAILVPPSHGADAAAAGRACSGVAQAEVASHGGTPEPRPTASHSGDPAPAEIVSMRDDPVRSASRRAGAARPDVPGRERQDRASGRLPRARQPLLMSINDFTCQDLCPIELRNLVDAMNQVTFRLGADYKALAISLNPANTAQDATSDAGRGPAPLQAPGRARRRRRLALPDRRAARHHRADRRGRAQVRVRLAAARASPTRWAWCC